MALPDSDDVLCDSGSEAMFADLCYFSVRSVQVSSKGKQLFQLFLFLI